MDLVIYGAKGIALGTYEAIKYFCPERKIRCFLVTEQKGNAEFLSGAPVLELDKFAEMLPEKEREKIEVLIAVPENVMPAIEKLLDERGFFRHTRMTSMRWAEWMGNYYSANQKYQSLSALPVGCHKPELKVFMAKFFLDKPLETHFDLPEWFTPIQVGAALGGPKVAEILDCDGPNISGKNGNYSELTGLYWVWKNCLLLQGEEKKEEYYGLAHYRRFLALSEEDLMRLWDNGVDVVLPYPMPYEPNIEEHHKQYLKENDWEAVLKAIRELEPAYAKFFPEILKQRYFYNYNIIIARKKVLADYCSWLFPILERVEELSIPKGEERSDRYIGYIGESLENLYFMANCMQLKIMHAGCQFLS